MQPLLDAVVAYLPSPTDVAAVSSYKIKGKRITDELVTRESTDDAPCRARVKIATDAYIGQLSYLRIYSGTIKAGESIFNATKGKRGRVGRILRMHANQREDIELASRRDRRRCWREGYYGRRYALTLKDISCCWRKWTSQICDSNCD